MQESDCTYKIPQKKSLIDVYSGGRHLNAIDFNTTLNMSQKHLMLVLGSQLDFRDIQKSKRYISVKALSEKMSCTPRMIHKITSELKAMGYIEIEHRFEDNKQKSNYYSITDKVFLEYCAKIWPEQYSGGGVNNMRTEIPKKELPQENKIISKDIILCAHAANLADVVDIDIDQIELEIDAEMPLEEKSSISVQEQFSKRIKKRAAEIAKDRPPRVTTSHRKMIAMFRPKPSLKSFVKDNDIHFFTDQVIEKFGERSHAIIAYLFTRQTDAGKCGEIPWSVNKSWEYINAANELLKDVKNE
jgi:DNA-binding MarR family transcriptional regulator